MGVPIAEIRLVELGPQHLGQMRDQATGHTATPVVLIERTPQLQTLPLTGPDERVFFAEHIPTGRRLDRGDIGTSDLIQAASDGTVPVVFDAYGTQHPVSHPVNVVGGGQIKVYKGQPSPTSDTLHVVFAQVAPIAGESQSQTQARIQEADMYLRRTLRGECAWVPFAAPNSRHMDVY